MNCSWRLAGIGPGSALQFELIDVLPGVSSVTLYYRNHRGRTVAETMFFDPSGLVVRAAVHYR
jgi:hypothetical protein